jgi:hypothetical protein
MACEGAKALVGPCEKEPAGGQRRWEVARQGGKPYLLTAKAPLCEACSKHG